MQSAPRRRRRVSSRESTDRDSDAVPKNVYREPQELREDRQIISRSRT
ncbi:MAG: hypothetical protein MZU95_15190 [Desulfomicrobium escambiense]|nr:hypothetical protein [Desulfomicrobium escambiense]